MVLFQLVPGYLRELRTEKSNLSHFYPIHPIRLHPLHFKFLEEGTCPSQCAPVCTQEKWCPRWHLGRVGNKTRSRDPAVRPGEPAHGLSLFCHYSAGSCECPCSQTPRTFAGSSARNARLPNPQWQNRCIFLILHITAQISPPGHQAPC